MMYYRNSITHEPFPLEEREERIAKLRRLWKLANVLWERSGYNSYRDAMVDSWKSRLDAEWDSLRADIEANNVELYTWKRIPGSEAFHESSVQL